MKPGRSLQRHTELKATKPLERRSELRRGGQLSRKPNARKLRRSKVLNPRADIRKLRKEVYARAGGRCDLCGLPLSEYAFEAHHRKKRSQGGLDEATNLVALHSVCHHDLVHGRPAWAYAHGFLVRRDADPATQPVFRHRSRWQVPGETQWHGAEALEAGAA